MTSTISIDRAWSSRCYYHSCETLAEIPDGAVHCVVTSPPYFGLRDYGAQDGQIGLEDTPEAYVHRIVAVFREVRRVLHPSGVVLLNLGDSFAANRSYQVKQTLQGKYEIGERYSAAPRRVPANLKPKDLIGIPWMVAFALQADGWWLRGDYVWAKKNVTPESISDRCTRSHEYVFHLAKSEQYYWDADAIREPFAESTLERMSQPTFKSQTGGAKDYGGHRSARKALDNLEQHSRYKTDHPVGANKRDVWTIASEPFSTCKYECQNCGRSFITEAYIPDHDVPGQPQFTCRDCGSFVERSSHFAVMPTELISICIRAGSSEYGVCSICNAPWKRIIDRQVRDQRDSDADVEYAKASGAHSSSQHPTTFYAQATSTIRRSVGWEPTCAHRDVPVIPSVVLDPFLGSGTVAEVAEQLGRQWAGFEINEGYREFINERTRQCGLFAQAPQRPLTSAGEGEA